MDPRKARIFGSWETDIWRLLFSQAPEKIKDCRNCIQYNTGQIQIVVVFATEKKINKSGPINESDCESASQRVDMGKGTDVRFEKAELSASYNMLSVPWISLPSVVTEVDILSPKMKQI